MGITRPPRSEQRRSQIYTVETVTPVDSNVAPTLLPSLATETSSPRSSSLDGSPQSAIRRSAARRDISLTRDDGPPRPASSQAYANGSSSRPHTPRSSGAGGSHRGSPDIWSQSHARTPTGGSLDSRDLTPRQASPHTPRQTSSPTSSLHSPPVLLTRSALSSRYSSPTQSTSFRTRTPSAEQAAPAPQAKAEHTSSGSEYSLDDDSSESQGWAGIDDEPMSSSPPRSPLLAQTLAEARQHQSFVAPMQDDAVEHIDQVEHVRRSSSAISLRLGGRNGSIDAGATADSEEGSRRSSVTDARRAASTPNRMSVAEEKGQDVAWWNAGVVEQLADPLEPVDSASQADFHAIVSGASPEVDPKGSHQVGSTVDWDESKPARPTTPQPSSYQPHRPSISPVLAPVLLPPISPPPRSGSLPPIPDRDTSRQTSRRSESASRGSPSPTTSSTSQEARRPSNIAIPPSLLPSTMARPSSAQDDDGSRLSPNRAAFRAAQAVGPPPVAPETVESNASPAPQDLAAPLLHLPSPLPSPSEGPPPPNSVPSTKLSADFSKSSSSPSPRRNRKDLPPPPEKSRKRASTIRRISRQMNDEEPPPPSPTYSPDTMDVTPPTISTTASSSSSSDFMSSARRGSATPVTPLSASDFATAYAGKEFGRSASVESELPLATDGDEVPIPSSSSHIRAPALAETPPAAATVPLFSSDSDEAAPRDPYFESNLARSDSLTVMASLTAQLSDAIAKVGSGNEMDGSDAATPSTRRPTRTDALAAEDVGKRLSDAPSDDSYHDAQMASTTASPQLPPLPVDISPAGSRPTSPSASSRMDAKARAAAFVADLKRARAAAGISTTASSPTNGSSSSLAFASPTLSLPTSPLVPRDSPSSAVEAFHTPYQPSDSPNAPSLPPLNHSTSFVWDISTPHSASVSTHTTPELVQPEASPPPPPPRTTFERRISEGELPALPKSPALPSALPALPASPASPAVAAMSAIRLDKLHRRRPLPACLSIAPELKKARTPGDRAAIYAKKVNQLRKETSGLSDWIGAMGGPTGASGRTATAPAPTSPDRSRRERDVSSASFPSRGDGYKAREIPNGTFSPRDLAPSVPFPGVLTIPSGPPASASARYSASGASGKPSAINPKGSFFSGLGRKASKRSTGGSGSLGSIQGPGGSLSSSSSSSTSSARRPSIGHPLISAPSSSSLASTASGRPMGPRMPGTSRASMDVNMYSATSPSSPGSSPNLQRLASRASFSGMPTSSSSFASSGASTTTMVDEEKLDRLENVLPLVERGALLTALLKAGGDEVLAVSVALSDEAMRKQ